MTKKMVKGEAKRVCPHCGVVVSDLGRHYRRDRCAEQHRRKIIGLG